VPRSSKDFDLAQGATLGLTLAATLSLFAYLGYRIDEWLQCFPIGVIAGSVLGLAAGMTYVIRKVADLQARGKDEDPGPGGDGRDERH
jgi:F0F1-type ATP synthase assembly protein I